MRVASLVVTNGSEKGRRYQLGLGIATLGRDQTNSIQIVDPEISRRHAEMHVRTDEIVILDLGSSNGTYVNGNDISSQVLKPGDQIRLGKTSLIFGDATDSYLDDSDPTIQGSDDQTFDSTHGETKAVSPATVDWIFRAKSNLQVMYLTALATSHHTEIDRLLDRLIELVFTWIAADRACVMLHNKTTGEFETQCIRDRTGKIIAKEEFDVCQGIIDFVKRTNEGILSADIKSDSRVNCTVEFKKTESAEIICVPIRGKSGVRGLIYVDSLIDLQNTNAPRFDEDQMKMLIAIGHQAAVAIENANYYSTLLRSERATAVGQVMESLSHHIKNILQSINGGTHLIEEGLKHQNHGLIEKGWHIVQRNQDSISSLVMDMLVYSKQRSPNSELGDFNRLVEKVVKTATRRASYYGVDLQWVPNQNLPPILFDAAILERAISNLVATAINSCRDNSGGEVKISCDVVGEFVNLMIVDNGTSLSAEELETIFDPLVINEYSNRTGIGMAVSRKSILEHNGKLDVFPGENSVGMVYLVKIPLQDKTDSAGIGDADHVIDLGP